MNRLFAFFAALALSLPVFAIEENEVRAVDIKDFDALVVSLSAKIDYQCSTEPYLELSGAGKKLLDAVEIVEKDGVLSIGMKKGESLRNVSRIRVRVGSRKISRIDLPGAVDFRSHGDIRSNGDFSLSLSGAGSAATADFGRNTTKRLPSLGSFRRSCIRPSGVGFASSARRRVPDTGSQISATLSATLNTTSPVAMNFGEIIK